MHLSLREHGTQAADDFRGTHVVLDDVAHDFLDFRDVAAQGQQLQHRLRIAEYRCQRLRELVREGARELAEYGRAPQVRQLLALFARLAHRAFLRRDVGPRNDGAAFGAMQALDGDLVPEHAAARGLTGEFHTPAHGEVRKHLADAVQELRSGGVAAGCRDRAGLQVLITHPGALERLAVRVLDEPPPGLIRLDDHAVLIQYRDLIVDRGEDRRVQHLGLATARLGATQG